MLVTVQDGTVDDQTMVVRVCRFFQIFIITLEC